MLLGCFSEFKHRRQRRIAHCGVNPHFARQRCLHLGALQIGHQLHRQLGRFGTLQYRRPFHLAEHAAFQKQIARGRLGIFALAEKHFRSGAGGIAHHQRARAAVLAEIGVISIAPAFGHFHAVLAHLRPPAKRLRFAHAADIGHQKAQARAGCGRVGHHQQIFVSRFGKVFQCFRQRQAFLGKPFFIVIQRHISIIHRQRARQAGNRRRGAGLAHGQNAALRSAADIGIIQTIYRIGNRLRPAQNQLVEHFIGAARFNHRYFRIVGALEFGQHFFGQAERFVHRQPHFGLRRRSKAEPNRRQAQQQIFLHLSESPFYTRVALSYQAALAKEIEAYS